jgi:hypothetical protein
MPTELDAAAAAGSYNINAPERVTAFETQDLLAAAAAPAAAVPLTRQVTAAAATDATISAS